jgi:hypothetical protein
LSPERFVFGIGFNRDLHSENLLIEKSWWEPQGGDIVEDFAFNVKMLRHFVFHRLLAGSWAATKRGA